MGPSRRSRAGSMARIFAAGTAETRAVRAARAKMLRLPRPGRFSYDDQRRLAATAAQCGADPQTRVRHDPPRLRPRAGTHLSRLRRGADRDDGARAESGATRVELGRREGRADARRGRRDSPCAAGRGPLRGAVETLRRADRDGGSRGREDAREREVGSEASPRRSDGARPTGSGSTRRRTPKKAGRRSPICWSERRRKRTACSPPSANAAGAWLPSSKGCARSSSRWRKTSPIPIEEAARADKDETETAEVGDTDAEAESRRSTGARSPEEGRAARDPRSRAARCRPRRTPRVAPPSSRDDKILAVHPRGGRHRHRDPRDGVGRAVPVAGANGPAVRLDGGTDDDPDADGRRLRLGGRVLGEGDGGAAVARGGGRLPPHHLVHLDAPRRDAPALGQVPSRHWSVPPLALGLHRDARRHPCGLGVEPAPRPRCPRRE